MKKTTVLSKIERMSSIRLDNKKKQVNNLIRSPHRKGINYLYLLDLRKAIADEQYARSVERVIDSKREQAGFLAANRDTVAEYFGTGPITTNRILMNCNWGFFAELFGTAADFRWSEAHPFWYASGYRDFSSIDLRFIERHFNDFAGKQFTTWSGWGVSEQTGAPMWQYKSWFRNEAISIKK